MSGVPYSSSASLSSELTNLQTVGIGTSSPTEKLHIVDGNILATGGTINVGKNENQTAHFGRGRISHFDITDANTGATSSSVSISHHDCDAATNFALLQTRGKQQGLIQ